MYKILIIILVLICCISNSNLHSQQFIDKPTDNRSSYGFFGGISINQHSADFVGIDFPQIPSCCPRFESGSGIGFDIGLLYDLPLSDKLTLQLRLAYSDLSGTLSTIEPSVVSSPQGTAENGEFEHSVKGMFNIAGFRPSLGYRLSDRFFLSGGLNVGYLLSKDFEQKEVLKSPSYGTFFNTNSRVRNEYSGELTNPASLMLSVLIGAGYYLPLNQNETIYLVPELNYSIGLSNFSNDVNWKSNQLVAGIAFKWSPREVKPPKVAPPPPPPPPMPLPPPPPEVPVLDATIIAVAVDENGKESDIAQLKVEQFLSSRMHPLLNFIFFDENSDRIPSRYKLLSKEEAKDFSIRRLYSMSTIDVYSNILNIVAQRFASYPQAELTLVGTNSDINQEKGNLTLSRNRAQRVKDYFVNVWGLDPDRIKIEERNLPLQPSNNTIPDGQAENRRVEILTNVDNIFEPIIVQDTLIESNPPVFRFKPNVNAQMGINKWKIIASQSAGDIKVFSGSGVPPASIEWDLSKEYEAVPKLNEPLNYRLEVVDNDNKVWSSQIQMLPVEQYTLERKILEQIEDKEIDRFSLILFGFNSAELGESNIKIAEFAKRRIYPNSTVEIKGYSDRIGEERFNLELSQRRALAAARALGVDPKSAVGLGNSVLLYDNDLPEGRFYCRTVNIEIITPISYDF